MRPKIVVVGSSNTDMVIKVPRLPGQGETILGEDFLTHQGGKGANQAVAAARAGAGVTFIACVSDDAFGEKSVEKYSKEGIDTSYIKVKPGISSGVALINVAEDGQNSISVAPGANSHLWPADILSCRSAFDGAQMVLVQLEIPMETVEVVAQITEQLGIPLILNPAPGAAVPEGLLRRVSVITPNESEAAILASVAEVNEESIAEIADKLHQMGVKSLIITLASKGVYISDGTFRGVVPAYVVKAVDSTAAGDVFNGALAARLASGETLINAVDFAQRAAAISVTRRGAQPSAPYLEEIEGFQGKD